MNRDETSTRVFDTELRGSATQVRTQAEARKPVGMWATFVLLVAVLAGVTVYGYRALRKDNVRLGQLSDALNSLGNLSDRLSTAENQMHSWAGSLTKLTDRLAGVERRLNNGFEAARKHAEDLNEALEARIQDQIDERSYLVDARLLQLETQMKADHAQLAELREEVARTRQQLAVVHQDTDREMTGLKERTQQNNHDVTSLAQRFEHRRVDFEVAKSRVYAPVPGISLKITETTPRYQRFSAWVFFLPDRRTLWVHDQGVQQPVVFYSRQNGERYEVVITSVTRGSAVGYALLPPVGKPEGQDAVRAARAEAPRTTTPSL